MIYQLGKNNYLYHMIILIDGFGAENDREKGKKVELSKVVVHQNN